jgi:hypothetical protein
MSQKPPKEIEVSCAGCRHHVINGQRTEFICSEGVVSYPNETSSSCANWRRPARGKNGGELQTRVNRLAQGDLPA